MSLLLKIVEGPNKGAEIALVEGVVVTVGKADACDIVLADQTLADEPMKVETGAGGVTLDGERLEPLHVVKRGSTAFAVGPADSAWGALVWPEERPAKRETSDDKREEEAPRAPDPAPDESQEPRRRRGCLGCLVAVILLLLLLAGLCWAFRDVLMPYAERAVGRPASKPSAADAAAAVVPSFDDVISRHGLSVTNRNGREVVVGDFKTRADRLAVTAEAYAVKPGVELDFADGESLKTAVSDTLSLVGETKITVSAVTSRVAVLSGTVANIHKALAAIKADVPKLANVDVADVRIARPARHASRIAPVSRPVVAPPKPVSPPVVSPVPQVLHHEADKPVVKHEESEVSLPVCGILSTPYPCLVLQDGRRILEGSPVGEWTVVKIDVDSVVITNSTGRFVWKP